MNVAINLFEYLKKYDRAELVGFGTFIVQTCTAELSEDKTMIMPPKKILTFVRKQENNMDFVHFMAKHEFISSETALTWIKQYADSLNNRLETTNQVLLNSIGTIKKIENDKYVFEALPSLNLMDESFGLDAVDNIKTFDKIEPIEQNTQKLEKTLPEKDNTLLTAELVTDEENDNEIEKLVDIIREKADKILEVSQKMDNERTDNKIDNKSKHHKSYWKWLFVVLLIIFLCCLTCIGSYYMGWLQKYEWAKPLTNKLSYYIMTKDEVNHKFDKPQPVTDIIPDIPSTDTIINKPDNEQPVIPVVQEEKKQKATCKPIRRLAKSKPHPPKEKKEIKIDYSAIIQMRPSNILGYDVIKSTQTERIKAENVAREAKSMGIDSYVITRTRLEQPIYYVSYGSRSTLGEAKELMQNMIESLGGDYFIIVRKEN